MMMCYDLMCT